MDSEKAFCGGGGGGGKETFFLHPSLLGEGASSSSSSSSSDNAVRRKAISEVDEPTRRGKIIREKETSNKVHMFTL